MAASKTGAVPFFQSVINNFIRLPGKDHARRSLGLERAVLQSAGVYKRREKTEIRNICKNPAFLTKIQCSV
jgi:hypothetical protein